MRSSECSFKKASIERQTCRVLGSSSTGAAVGGGMGEMVIERGDLDSGIIQGTAFLTCSFSQL